MARARPFLLDGHPPGVGKTGQGNQTNKDPRRTHATPLAPNHPEPPWFPATPRGFAVLERRYAFWILTCVLLAVMAGMMLYAAIVETVVYDERTYLTAGGVYWTHHNLWYNVEQPPLAKLIAGGALLPLDLEPPIEGGYGNVDETSRRFVFHNSVDADRVIFAGRLPFIVLTLAFGLVLALWVKHHFGPSVAVFSLAFYAFDPSILAHGHYATTDMIAAIFYFLAILLWGRVMRLGRWYDLLLAGLTLGLALGTKFSTLSLFGIFLLLALLRWSQDRKGRLLLRLGWQFVVVAGIGLAVLFAQYYPETAAVLGGHRQLLSVSLHGDHDATHLFRSLTETFRLPNHSYLVGLHELALHDEIGSPSYLLGEHMHHGHWYYFLIAFLVKTPTALLAGLLACLVVSAQAVRRLRFRWRTIPFAWVLLTVPPVFYFACTLRAHINIGHRHILLVYPFFYVLVPLILMRSRVRLLLPVLAILLVAETAAVTPHYLAFFNTPSGGPANGPRYLLDSNLDWGQDLKKLAKYVERNHLDNVCLCYFGLGDPPYYGLDAPLPPWQLPEGGEEPDCVVAVSASMLYCLSGDPQNFEWLRWREPDERIGYSIYLYDLRKDKRDGTEPPSRVRSRTLVTEYMPSGRAPIASSLASAVHRKSPVPQE